MQNLDLNLSFPQGVETKEAQTKSVNGTNRRLLGYGMPWVTMVLSKATTGFPAFNADDTLSCTWIKSETGKLTWR